MQATGSGGQIRIEVDSQSATAIDLLISDDGPGIDKDLQQRVFEPFFTTRSKGTGLGLPVVRAIVRAHQGEVWIDEQVTKGTRFVVRLPRCEQRNI
jgi:two-component system sensor histidine kinase FlrB